MKNISSGKYDISDNRKTVELIRQGDEDCFDAMYRFYYKPLCAYASRFVSAGVGENIVQDTMLWVWENRTTLIPDMSLKGLLFMIVRNKSLDRIKHNNISSRVHMQLADKFADRFDDPDFYLENELTELLENALATLTPEMRETFLMSRVQNMTHREIAEIQGVSVQTVNYRIGQTMKALRRELKDYLPLILLLLNYLR